MGGDLEKRGRLRPHKRSGAPRVYRPGPFAVIYTALLVAGVAGAVGVYFLLLAAVPGAKAARLDVAKTALLVIGGSGAVAGLYVAYRKQRTDEANHIRDQDKLFTERYTQAAAQLGSDKAAVRLAGVYALARIADDSQRDRPTCLEVLCAYLRMPYDPDADSTDKAESEVRATAQTVLAHRLRTDHPGFWKDAYVNLRGARLVDLDFTTVTIHTLLLDKATVTGNARLNKATFTNALFDKVTFTGNAWFHGATFTGIASLAEATFTDHARFDWATFTGDAWFLGAAFAGDAGFSKATFANASFSKAAFANAHFLETTFNGNASFAGATFNGNARFGEATFIGDAGFDGATFTGKAWFRGATFTRASFLEATFTKVAGFDGATFIGGAEFGGATFNPDHRPVWPDGFVEPADIKWSSPAPAPGAGGT